MAAESSTNVTDQLCAAIMSGNVKAMNVAIAAGAEIDKQNDKGLPPIALPQNTPATVRCLIAAGANMSVKVGGEFKYSLLHIYATQNNVTVLRALLEAGADPCTLSHDGQPPLNFAITYATPPLDETIKLFKEFGADLNYVAPKEFGAGSALDFAVQGKKLEVIKSLLREGAWPGRLTDDYQRYKKLSPAVRCVPAFILILLLVLRP